MPAGGQAFLGGRSTEGIRCGNPFKGAQHGNLRSADFLDNEGGGNPTCPDQEEGDKLNRCTFHCRPWRTSNASKRVKDPS